VSLYLKPKGVKQMEKYLRKKEMKRPAIDRAGIRAFMGNPEDFSLSWYGIFMASVPIILFGVLVWSQW
jgi:hypothetical protein